MTADGADTGAPPHLGCVRHLVRTHRLLHSRRRTRCPVPRSGQGAPGPSPSLRTAFTDLVGVRHPLVQTGMGWVAGPRLVSATANAGALGILASATMTVPELRAAIREVASRTGHRSG